MGRSKLKVISLISKENIRIGKWNKEKAICEGRYKYMVW